MECPVEYKGKSYSSLREFADAYQLNYPKVTAHYRRGETLDQIVQKCQFTTASKTEGPPPETPKRKYVEYDGVQYTSIYAAADALGLSPSRVYSIRKRMNCSAEAAIEYALDYSTPAGGGRKAPKAKVCVIEGVEYPSQEAALAAYRMKRITVYSRMKRENISFEEAIIRGKNSALYRKPAESLFLQLHLMPMDQELTAPQVMADLSRSLAYYHCQLEYLCDVMSGTPVLLVDGQSYVFYNKDARGVEMVTELPFSLPGRTISALNESYVAVKFFRRKTSENVVLSAFQSAQAEGQRIEPLLNAWFSYTSIRDILMRRFASEKVLSAIPAAKNTKTEEEPAGV